MKTANRSVFFALILSCSLLPLLSCSQNKKEKTVKTTTRQTNPAPVKQETKNVGGTVVYGKYSCTATKYSNGSYEFIPRGSFVLEKSGKYTYNGFETPSTGTFTVDATGDLHFKGGYLDGGKAEKIDRPNKFFLVFPTIPDNRWTCSLVQ